MEKIICLDFDGVITASTSGYKLIPEKMELIGKIIDETNAKILLITSWRRDNLKNTIKFITDIDEYFVCGNPFPYVDKIIGQTDYLAKWCNRYCRGDEIKKWFDENRPDMSDVNYIIIDDDSDFLDYQKPRHIQTCDGITEKESELAIKMLIDKNFNNPNRTIYQDKPIDFENDELRLGWNLFVDDNNNKYYKAYKYPDINDYVVGFDYNDKNEDSYTSYSLWKIVDIYAKKNNICWDLYAKLFNIKRSVYEEKELKLIGEIINKID